jgi:hypothetical protein
MDDLSGMQGGTKKLCTKLALFTRLYRDAGQQNVKFIKLTCRRKGVDDLSFTHKYKTGIR